MDEREMARWLAVARVNVGAGLFLFPGLAAATWVGRDAKTAGVRTLSRGFGMRDAIIGAGLFRALENGDSDEMFWPLMLRIRPSGATLSCCGGMALVWVVVLVVVLPSAAFPVVVIVRSESVRVMSAVPSGSTAVVATVSLALASIFTSCATAPM